MLNILDPSTPVGTVVLGILKALGTVIILAVLAWLLGPLKWPSQKRRLHKIILSDRRFRFVFNPDANRSKIVTFRADGEIGEGQNNNENRWRIRRGKLEILGYDGKLYSRFAYDQKTGRLTHTNDPDCRSILGQYFTPLFVILGTQSRTNDDEVQAIASYLSRGATSFKWFRENTEFDYSDKEFNKIVYRNPDLFKAMKIVKRDKDGKKSRTGLPGMKLTAQDRKQKE